MPLFSILLASFFPFPCLAFLSLAPGTSISGLVWQTNSPASPPPSPNTLVLVCLPGMFFLLLKVSLCRLKPQGNLAIPGFWIDNFPTPLWLSSPLFSCLPPLVLLLHAMKHCPRPFQACSAPCHRCVGDIPARTPDAGLGSSDSSPQVGGPRRCRAAGPGCGRLRSALEPAQPGVYLILLPKQTLPWVSC